MIIGANQDDFQDIICAAPDNFGIFYEWGNEMKNKRASASITKQSKRFRYEFHLNNTLIETLEFKTSVELVNRMGSDNAKFNESGKCTIEF